MLESLLTVTDSILQQPEFQGMFQSRVCFSVTVWCLSLFRFMFSRHDGGRLHVGVPGRQEGPPQRAGRVPDGQRAVWSSGQRGSQVLALPVAAVHQRHRVSGA